MFICFVVVAGVMGGSFNKVTGYIPKNSASTILAFECLFTAGFAWSWGPLGWLGELTAVVVWHKMLSVLVSAC